MPSPCGIADYPVADTPIAVFDFETTGLNPGYDRVVEVSVIRLDPGHPPRLVFDTLINPKTTRLAESQRRPSTPHPRRATRFNPTANHPRYARPLFNSATPTLKSQI